MVYLLRVDSSLKGDTSFSRRLTERAGAVWLRAHAGGEIRVRDLAANPLPHFDEAAENARKTAPDDRTPEQAERWALARELADEVADADAVVLALPLYNWAPPSGVKAWIDHIIGPGLSRDAESGAPLFAGKRFIVLVTRGGGYGPEAPRYGWDHATPWIEHVLTSFGVTPEIIAVEMTLSVSNPALADFRPMLDRDLKAAEDAIDKLW